MSLPAGVTDIAYQEGDKFQTDADALVSDALDLLTEYFPGSTPVILLYGPEPEPGQPRAHLIASPDHHPEQVISEVMLALYGPTEAQS